MKNLPSFIFGSIDFVSMKNLTNGNRPLEADAWIRFFSKLWFGFSFKNSIICFIKSASILFGNETELSVLEDGKSLISIGTDASFVPLFNCKFTNSVAIVTGVVVVITVDGFVLDVGRLLIWKILIRTWQIVKSTIS